jgi:hypothetical protein
VVEMWTNIVGSQRRESDGPLILKNPISMVETHIRWRNNTEFNYVRAGRENYIVFSIGHVTPLEVHQGKKKSS